MAEPLWSSGSITYPMSGGSILPFSLHEYNPSQVQKLRKPCAYCRVLLEREKVKCPHCGAPKESDE